jgi:hypothetical protein
MKERLKAKAARSLEALEAELRPSHDIITPQNARGWFRHSGCAYTDPESALATRHGRRAKSINPKVSHCAAVVVVDFAPSNSSWPERCVMHGAAELLSHSSKGASYFFGGTLANDGGNPSLN